jgi:predicted site-specific integrase-resolvase
MNVSSRNIDGENLERIAYNKKEVCEVLGLSEVTLWRLEKRGLLKPIFGIRHKIYSVEAVKKFVSKTEGDFL